PVSRTSRQRPYATLCPYTTLFRSIDGTAMGEEFHHVGNAVAVPRAPECRIGLGGLHGEGPLRRESENGIVAARPLLRECADVEIDRKSTRLNSSHVKISYAVFCLK